jgi:hypothetical protein
MIAAAGNHLFSASMAELPLHRILQYRLQTLHTNYVKKTGKTRTNNAAPEKE